MKLDAFLIFAAASFGSWLLRPAFALAQGGPAPSLEYAAPTPDCASNDAFQALVKAEIARYPSSESGRRLSVRIVQQDGSYTGTLTTEAGAVRTLTAARCDDVTAALAVVIAVAEPSGATPTDTPFPPAKRSAQVDLSPPNEPDREPAEGPSRFEWRVGARGFGSHRPSATTNVGALGTISLELPWGFHKMMFELGAGYAAPFGAPPVEVNYLIVDTQACLLDLPFEDTGISLLGCLHLDGAQFRSTQQDPSPPVNLLRNGQVSVGAWPTVAGGAFWTGASARLRWQSSERVFVEANVDAMYGTVSAGEDNEPAWLAVGIGLGLQI